LWSLLSGRQQYGALWETFSITQSYS
jgi:hypothetical protein